MYAFAAVLFLILTTLGSAAYLESVVVNQGLVTSAVDTSSNFTSSPSRGVTELAPETFYDFLAEHGPVFINFCKPHAGLCKYLDTEWQARETHLDAEASDAVLATVDCEAHKDLCEDENIQAFPTLRWMDSANDVQRSFHGNRSADKLLRLVHRMLEETVSDAEHAEHATDMTICA